MSNTPHESKGQRLEASSYVFGGPTNCDSVHAISTVYQMQGVTRGLIEQLVARSSGPTPPDKPALIARLTLRSMPGSEGHLWLLDGVPLVMIGPAEFSLETHPSGLTYLYLRADYKL